MEALPCKASSDATGWDGNRKVVQIRSSQQAQDHAETLPQRRWTVAEYHRMVATGILTGGDRVELIDGYILERVPQEPPHASTTSSFGNEFVLLFAGKAWVRQQLPLSIAPDSEPEPDIAVVRIDENRYRDKHPTPEDVFLLIEVAASTLTFDRHQKAQLYAKANIQEYWVIDIKKRQVLVMRDPQNNRYQTQTILGINDKVSSVAFPDSVIQLSKLMG
ncbi:MAG: Uma2 family endonuclease [Symploca sp. SIO2B6]|nr:Uma2 family endonuclease [Symploca sp. SIO2B6]